MGIISVPHHEISCVLDGIQIKGWETYEITKSMLEPADHFSIRIPFNRDMWDFCKTDTPITVLCDDTPLISGYIDERLVPEDDESVEINGRDKVGRLVQESAPGINFQGLGILQLAQAVVKPWFTTATLSNARNRLVVRGKGKKARAGTEPVKLNTRVGTQIMPGMARAHVLQLLCEEAGYLFWSSADGKEIIIGEPNYDQEVQFRFFMPAANSKRGDESTVLGMGVRDSVHDRYSRIIIVGSGTGTDANYGAQVASRYGEVRNNPLTPEGDGLDFSAPKRLVQQRPVTTHKGAVELAQREMDRRDGIAKGITVRAPGHGQVIAGAYTTLFSFDLLASVEDERTGTKGTYIITEVTYRSSRKGGEETLLKLVPKGARLVA